MDLNASVPFFPICRVEFIGSFEFRVGSILRLIALPESFICMSRTGERPVKRILDI